MCCAIRQRSGCSRWTPIGARTRSRRCASVRPGLPRLREVIRIADFAAFVDAASADVRLPSVSPLDPCVIMFTSGTTGAQKGVMFHHKGVINMSFFTQERGGLAGVGCR